MYLSVNIVTTYNKVTIYVNYGVGMEYGYLVLNMNTLNVLLS